MGRKIAIEKTENPTKRQVTFSKRRSSLIKKANEISILCDVDIALIALPPSGRISKFSSRSRIEDLIEFHIKLPGGKRHGRNPYQMTNIELKLRPYFEASCFMPAGLQNYDPEAIIDPSLDQLLHCETNLKRSLQQVMDRKEKLLEDMMKEAKGKSDVPPMQGEKRKYKIKQQAVQEKRKMDGYGDCLEIGHYLM